MPDDASEDGPEREIIGVGGEINAQTLLQAYAVGCFPMPTTLVVAEGGEEAEYTLWIAPDPRAVLSYPGMHVSRSLRRSMRGFETSLDREFAAVLDGCADPSRPDGWIDDAYIDSYFDLHTAGFAHSVEVWQDGELVGGLIAVELGGLVCADSKFRRVRDASKAAVAGLSQRVFTAAHGPERLIDAQWPTAHLMSLGFRELGRDEYQERLGSLLRMPPALGSPQLVVPRS